MLAETERRSCSTPKQRRDEKRSTAKKYERRPPSLLNRLLILIEPALPLPRRRGRVTPKEVQHIRHAKLVRLRHLTAVQRSFGEVRFGRLEGEDAVFDGVLLRAILKELALGE